MDFDYPRIYPILCSRGCPYKCTFCYHYERYRARSLDNIMEEISSAVKRYRANIIAVNDECFGLKKDYLYEFCNRMKKIRDETPWELKWVCQMTVRSVDRDRLTALKEAGCYMISYGFESF